VLKIKTVYLVWYNWIEYHYGELKKRKNLDGIFEDIEDAKFYISKQHYPHNYEVEEFYEYYKHEYNNEVI
jgi:hypothetical protein